MDSHAITQEAGPVKRIKVHKRGAVVLLTTGVEQGHRSVGQKVHDSALKFGTVPGNCVALQKNGEDVGTFFCRSTE